jgi:hypothetical protein
LANVHERDPQQRLLLKEVLMDPTTGLSAEDFNPAGLLIARELQPVAPQ